VPTVTSVNAAGASHAPGGAGFTLTVNGTNFVSTSVINFGVGTTKAEPTTFVSATKLTAAIPAGDMATAGNASVTVTNPNPGGGTTAATAFTIDGFTAGGPAAPTAVKAGATANITITITPTANGFPNAVTFSVTGLPKQTTATFNPTSVTPNGVAAMTTLMVKTTGHGAAPPFAPMGRPTSRWLGPLLEFWLVGFLLAMYAAFMARRRIGLPRYLAVAPLLLMLLSAAVLAGCAGPSTGGGTPLGSSQLTVTATSGSFTQNTNVTLTVQ
jgi:hypothetical protein